MVIDWEDYFMSLALLTAKRSKDPSTQVGAVFVNDQNHIVSVGYNGFPIGLGDVGLPWEKGNTWDTSKYFYVIHAEVNASLNKGSNSLLGSRLFVSLFPCNECSKMLIQEGIKEIIYFEDKYPDKPEVLASKRMLDLAKVPYRKFISQKDEINIKLK